MNRNKRCSAGIVATAELLALLDFATNWPDSAINRRSDKNKSNSNKMNQRSTAGSYTYHE